MTADRLIVGIDLGTTNSLVAVSEHAQGPRVIESEDGARSIPSVVRFGSVPAASGVSIRVEAVGSAARAEAFRYPEQTVSSAKRLLGRSASDVAETDAGTVAGYRVVEGPNATARLFIPREANSHEGAIVSPQEISAAILRELRSRASVQLGRDVDEAVVTVPAYFDDAQRQATRDAARLAGLRVARIVNEPTAAALAYGIGVGGRSRPKEQTIAVFDLGGGTFDISILRVIPPDNASAGDDTAFFQVLATAGDTHLGGDDIDALIVQWICERYTEATGRGLDLPPAKRWTLGRLAEQAKIKLSRTTSTTIKIEDVSGETHTFDLDRKTFEALALPLIKQAIAMCGRAVRDASLQPGDIDEVVLVGGSTRMPLVRGQVAAFFGREPYTALDPDEIVAIGAAEQAAIIAGERRDALLMDVVPLSLGIETAGGAVAKLIMRNSAAPARAVEMFSTQADGQTAIKLHVLQGEREMVADCRSLGVFELRGIPPMPAGLPQVEVEFLVDQNGVLNVSAVERRSGERASLQVVPNHGLTAEEIERIERESVTHAKDDMARHRVADLVANSKLDVKWTRDALERAADSLDDTYKQELSALITELAEFIERGDRDWRAVDPEAFAAARAALADKAVRLHEVGITRALRDDANQS